MKNHVKMIYFSRVKSIGRHGKPTVAKRQICSRAPKDKPGTLVAADPVKPNQIAAVSIDIELISVQNNFWVNE